MARGPNRRRVDRVPGERRRRLARALRLAVPAALAVTTVAGLGFLAWRVGFAGELLRVKELRFDAAGGVWRVAFAFDPRRRAILLVAGDKAGVGQKRFYQQLIDKADSRLDAHLRRLKG